MAYWKFRTCVVVPASQVVAFNKILQRNGYGANCLVVCDDNAVVDKGAAKGAKPTHYVFESQADSGLRAAINMAIAEVNKAVAAKDVGIGVTAMCAASTSESIKSKTIEAAGKQIGVDNEALKV